MKVYLSFTAIVTVLLMTMCFGADMKLYEREQWVFKEMTEEMAAGAALYLDEEMYGEGLIAFDYDKGEEYAKRYLENSKKNSFVLNSGSSEINISFEDDKRGYGIDNAQRVPAVTVELVSEHRDIFRLPFLSVKNMSRTSRYELKEV